MSEHAEVQAPVQIAQEHRLLGPTLWISGALLWSYVVLGELVVNVAFAETLAIPALFAVLVWNWFTVTKPLLDADRTGRAVFVAVASVALFVACLFLVTMMFGSTQRSHFEAVTVLLCLMGVVAYAVGRRMTSLPPRSRRTSGVGIAIWFSRIVVGLFTIAAVLSAMAHA